jgi:hypothetical protein
VAASRFADATASDGIKPETGGGVVVPEAVLNVVFTTGHRPLLVHDLKWIVCVPALMGTFVTSIS